MNQYTPPQPSLDCMNQWVLGRQLICISSGLAALPHSRTLIEQTGGDASFLVMPPVLTHKDSMVWSKAAHEVWVLEEEASNTPAIAQLVQYRRQSIPVSAGEHRSLLHAPELGTVRIFSVTPSGELVLQKLLTPLGESEPTLNAAWAGMHVFAKRIASIDASAVLRGDLTSHASKKDIQNDEITCLMDAAVLSAKLDESWVRWILAVLFAITVVGVILLQALAMAGWSVPMADIYAVFFMLVGSAYFWARKHDLNARQLVYRLIAQALEIHMVWRQASIHEPIAAQIPLRHRASLQWVRELLRFTSLHETDQSPLRSSRSVLESWLPSAISANQKLAYWHASRATRIAWAVRICYGLSGLLTLLLVCAPALNVWMDLAVGATLGIASSIGTLFLIFGGTLGYSANADLHQHLVQLLQRTQQALALDLPDHEYDELLLDVGRECIQSAVERAFR